MPQFTFRIGQAGSNNSESLIEIPKLPRRNNTSQNAKSRQLALSKQSTFKVGQAGSENSKRAPAPKLPRRANTNQKLIPSKKLSGKIASSHPRPTTTSSTERDYDPNEGEQADRNPEMDQALLDMQHTLMTRLSDSGLGIPAYKQTRCLAFQFFEQVYAPVAIHPPRNGDNTWSRPVLLYTYFQTLLHDAMFLGQVIAFSMVLLSMHCDAKKRISSTVLYHSNKSLVELRRRLSSKDKSVSTSEAVILTVITLLGLHGWADDWEAVGVHIVGLRRIIALKGGIENLGWGGYVKARILNAEAGWNSRLAVEEQRKLAGKEDRENLVYPRHPFSPSLCEKISRFSKGFSELALQRKLSFQFLNFLERIMTWLRTEANTASKAATSPSRMADDVLGRSNPSITERVLATALLAFCSSIERRMGQANPPVEIFIQAQGKYLATHPDIRACVDRDALEWTALILQDTVASGTDGWKWADQILRSKEVAMTAQKEAQLRDAFQLLTPKAKRLAG